MAGLEGGLLVSVGPPELLVGNLFRLAALVVAVLLGLA